MNAYNSRAPVTKRELVTERPPGLSNSDTNLFTTFIQAIPVFEKFRSSFRSGGLIDDLQRDLGNVLAAILKHFPLLVGCMTEPFGHSLGANKGHFMSSILVWIPRTTIPWLGNTTNSTILVRDFILVNGTYIQSTCLESL